VIVQDDRFSPKSGRVVAYVGSYDPHTKVAKLDGETIGNYLSNGAQPSDRVTGLLKKEGIKLPAWVKVSDPQKRAIRHPEKLRHNRPAGESAPAVAEETPAEPVAEEPAAKAAEPEGPAVEEASVPEEAVAEEPATEEAPAEPAAEAPGTEAKPEETA
jgi:small subunit ribosomal protein S16